MSGRVTRCCVVLVLALTSVSAVQKLHSLKALKKINFGQSVPRHSLVLLHWFANIVDIDNNNVIWLTFEPNSGDYGSHHYGNYEALLPRGFRYYTIGNLNHNQDRPMQLPTYVVRTPGNFIGGNRDRIIFSVSEQVIDHVYMTQHYDTSEHQGTPYDPAHTYQITTNLLREIRMFSLEGNQNTLSHLRNSFGSNADVSQIINTWSDLACLGLLLFIVIQEKYSSNQQNNRPENNRPQNNYNIPAIDIRPQNNYNYDRSPISIRPENNYNHDRSPISIRPENNYNYDRPSISIRPENNYNYDRPSISIRPENNYNYDRPSISIRPENNYNYDRPSISIRPENNYDRQYNIQQEDSQNTSDFDGFATCCFCICILVLISIFLAIYFATTS